MSHAPKDAHRRLEDHGLRLVSGRPSQAVAAVAALSQQVAKLQEDLEAANSLLVRALRALDHYKEQTRPIEGPNQTAAEICAHLAGMAMQGPCAKCRKPHLCERGGCIERAASEPATRKD